MTLADNHGTMEYEGPSKLLPALMDGDTMILPEATLPLPLGGRSPNPGRDGEDDWADYAAEVLIPRWAVECIRDGLVLGQELEEDCDPEHGYYPIETLKERVDVILRNPGEQDKWERIVGWGIDAVRHLDLEQANKWQGGLMELLESVNTQSMPLRLRLAFTRKNETFLAIFYWYSWAREGWSIVEGCFQRGGEIDDSGREKAKRLVAEGLTYWNRDPITGQPMALPDRMFNGHWFVGERRWMNGGVRQMLTCLTQLLTPSADRKLDMDVIWVLFASHMSHLATCAEREEDRLVEGVQREAIQAQTNARIAEAEVRVAVAEAEKFKAQGKAEAEAEARKRVEEKLAVVEEERRKEAEARAEAEALAEERKRMLDAWEPKLNAIAENTSATMAAVAGAGDKEAKANALVGAFRRFFDEVGPEVKPGGERARLHFKNFIVAPKNRAELLANRIRTFDAFRKRYSEWLELGRPDTGKDYLEKRAKAKSNKRKLEAARR